ncbi:hypothetical protein FACS1894110_26490 [Spirochaetia bacterium]|nr:hypothetical protein FACS1894110_26490 [Spirochaetia bacterium]
MLPAARSLKVQRTGLFLYLSFGVLFLIYALGFITDTYLFYAYGDKGLADFYREMQRINAALLWRSIWIIVFAVFLFLLELGSHAAGLFTLIVSGIVAAGSLVFSVASALELAAIRVTYRALDLSSLDRYIERGTITYTPSTLTFDLGLALCVLFLCASLFLIINVFYNAFNVKEGTYETI